VQIDAVEAQFVGAIDESVQIERASGEFILVAQGHTAKL
jgi:hypothetical protein